MTTMVSVEDVAAASTLVVFGMRPKLLPHRDPAYRNLVRRHREDDAFAETVEAVAAGMGVRVLAVNERAGIVLTPQRDSVFEVKLETYARATKTAERRDLEKVIHGIIHVAVAALAFPRPDDLANDSYVGRVDVEQVDMMVREACRVLADRTADEGDPRFDAPRLEQVWRAFARRPEVAATKDGRANPDSTRGMTARALRYLADLGLLAASDQEGTYRTTHRYQIEVRELAAGNALKELLDLGVVPITSPSGTLRHVGDPAEDEE
ncbi:hypothetical protein Q3V37_17440 [Micromonospora profundi]|uniref:Uncharacterized protein n=1 Tax=Micromonospora profundi TaxID=1420889 RepID=A0AAJ6HLU7_9ACTN|nr:hypothetical protein [Micromonospora profundi]WLS43205.1 hypothetical protein Q3V37_17440 [Micromonospora profundi]